MSSESDSEPSGQLHGFKSFKTEYHSGNDAETSSSDDDEPEFPTKRKSIFESEEIPAKKTKATNPRELMSSGRAADPAMSSTEPTNYSEQSRRMMNNMNFDKSKGLGKSGQGRVDIIEISTQKGRRGLGLKLDALDSSASGWDESMECLSIPEIVNWLDNNDDDDITNLSRDLLEAWIKRGTRKLTINDENKFCEDEVLQKVLGCKSAFDQLGARDMRGARTRSNPFETIKANIFMNRAAVKMANMDAMFDYMFTNPVDEAGNSMVREDDLLYFADVCAGPGGFSEYYLWRKKWQAKGFGFTLRGENDFKLHDFIAGSPETFDAYYGPKDNGDVFDPANIDAFSNYVMKQTESGVHVMMADGGFSVEGQENVQEILSKQLYLCQVLIALNIVRTGGHFVVKLFDLFTPFSVGLIFLVHKCFKKISICKPNTSRPANSERYLVCKWKKPGTDTIQRHLFDVNNCMFSNKSKESDILELVPYDVLKENDAFFQYIYSSNNEIGKNQIVGLHKIAAFCHDNTLNEARQPEYKSKCLALWKLEDNMRKVNTKSTPEQYVGELLKEWKSEKHFLADPGLQMNGHKLELLFPSIHGVFFVPLDNVENAGKNIRTLFLGRGGKEVMHYNATQQTWSPLKDVHLELAPKTLVYGEIVKELQGEGRSQVTIHAFHIIDGIILGGEDIRKYPLQERIRLCEKFAKALNKPYKTISNPDSTYAFTMPVRCKKLFPLSNVDHFFGRLENYRLKEGSVRLGYNVRNTSDPDRFYVPRALLFLSEVRDDYLKMFSKSKNKLYYFHKTKKTSSFPEQMKCVDETIASFKNTYVNRITWEWRHVHQVLDEDESKNIKKESDLMYRIDIKEFLISKINN